MSRLLVILVALASIASPALGQRGVTKAYDQYFRKYSKRFFGVGYDWRVFKAQSMAESNLDSTAQSWVGARGLMQLMPSTFGEIRSRNPEFGEVDDPRWNIAAGIYYDRRLWNLWVESDSTPDRLSFMLGAYNAGKGTIRRAQDEARDELLDHTQWASIEIVAPRVPRWRYTETLGYVQKIQKHYGRISPRPGADFRAFLGR